MKVNTEKLKNMSVVDMSYVLIAISLAYKYIEYPEDFTDEVGKILEEYSLITK